MKVFKFLRLAPPTLAFTTGLGSLYASQTSSSSSYNDEKLFAGINCRGERSGVTFSGGFEARVTARCGLERLQQRLSRKQHHPRTLPLPIQSFNGFLKATKFMSRSKTRSRAREHKTIFLRCRFSFISCVIKQEQIN